MLKKTLILFMSCISLCAEAQKVDKKLEEKLNIAFENFQGDIGIYVHHLKSDKIVAIHADTIFPTASLVKVPLLVGIFDQIKDGKYKLQDKFAYSESRIYGGSGLMQHYKDSAQTDLSTMISLMLTYSDNVTSLWIQELAGGGMKINPLLEKHDLQHTRINSRTVGREQEQKIYGWGQTTPKEMALLFTKIRESKIFGSPYDELMTRYLKNQFYNERSLSQIPAHINTLSKTGSVNQSRGEVVLVNAPSGDYVFAILTKNNKDQRWTAENEAEVLTRKVSNIIWNHFEPKHPFTAPAVVE